MTRVMSEEAIGNSYLDLGSGFWCAGSHVMYDPIMDQVDSDMSTIQSRSTFSLNCKAFETI